MSVLEKLKNNFLLFDGAMWTQLKNDDLMNNILPEELNLSHPEKIQQIHRNYVLAGADIITTNTFQTNNLNFSTKYLQKIISAAITNAKAAHSEFVAYDLGPLGQLLEPNGEITFEQAYEIFKIQALFAEENGVDLIIAETFSDLLEAKAAILAIKENTKLPIFFTMTYQNNGKTFLNVDPIAATVTLQKLGIEAIGLNCSVSPAKLLPIVEKIIQVAQIPVIVQANTDLKQFDVEKIDQNYINSYVSVMKKMVQMGARIIGGCCGTTPEFIKALKQMLQTQTLNVTKPPTAPIITCNNKWVFLNHGLTIVGDQLNPIKQPKLKSALISKNFDQIIELATEQLEAGAQLLDLNLNFPGINEIELVNQAIKKINANTSALIQISSTDPFIIKHASGVCNGRLLINSVTGSKESLDSILPIANKYGALVIGRCCDEEGIPRTSQQRIKIAQKIIYRASFFGLDENDIIINPLILTNSNVQEQLKVTLEVIAKLKKLNFCSLLNLADLSINLPNSSMIKATFLAQAVNSGLNVAMINPFDPIVTGVAHTLRFFEKSDEKGYQYQKYMKNNFKEKQTNKQIDIAKIGDLKEIIINSRHDFIEDTVLALLREKTVLEIVNDYLLPVTSSLAKKYEIEGSVSLTKSLETINLVQKFIENYLENENNNIIDPHQKIILACVAGEHHDLGKNFFKIVLESNGINVIDLGCNVGTETIMTTIKQEQVKLVALSAMTATTTQNMKKIIFNIKKQQLEVRFLVSGGTMNRNYAKFIGADYYAPNLADNLQLVQNFFAEQQVK